MVEAEHRVGEAREESAFAAQDMGSDRIGENGTAASDSGAEDGTAPSRVNATGDEPGPPDFAENASNRTGTERG